jgi:hypothetical protein
MVMTTRTKRVRELPLPRTPVDPRPLSEIVQVLSTQQLKLNALDDEIDGMLRRLTLIARERYVGRPLDVPFPPWGRLGWSGARGRWRFVVLDAEDCEDLSSMPRLCRVDACHVVAKLVEKMGLLPRKGTA